MLEVQNGYWGLVLYIVIRGRSKGITSGEWRNIHRSPQVQSRGLSASISRRGLRGPAKMDSANSVKELFLEMYTLFSSRLPQIDESQLSQRLEGALLDVADSIQREGQGVESGREGIHRAEPSHKIYLIPSQIQTS